MNLTNEKRKKIEEKILKTFSLLDTTGINANHYKEKFANMNNSEFLDFISSDFPYRFHYDPFKVEPKMSDIIKALKFLNVPLLEKVALPHRYQDANGNPVWSKECLVVYIHIKRVQQIATHKNKVPTKLKNRDPRTGLLLSKDKGAIESDRENEGLFAMSLYNTSKELNTFRADYMNAKDQAYSAISNLGTLSFDDIDIKNSDSLSKNMLNAYIISSMGISNIISPTYQTKYTIEKLKNKE